MSLLLLFHGGGPPPSANGTAALVAGANLASRGNRGAPATAALIAGANATASANRGAGAYALLVAGANLRSVFARGASGLAYLSAGANLRSQGGRGITADACALIAGAALRSRGRALRVGVPISRLTRLVLFLDPSQIAFTVLGKDGPYAIFLSISPLRLAARAGRQFGIGVSETTSCVVQLDNSENRAARIIGRPLRIHAEIYDGETLFFAGTVSRIKPGKTIDITIEA